MSWTIPRRLLDSHRPRVVFILAMAEIVLGGCGTSTVNQIGTRQHVDRPVRSVAIIPDDAALSRAIGVELAKRGCIVVDTQQTTTLLMRRNADALELMTPEVLAALSEGGVDAVVSVDAIDSIAGHLQKATVKMTSTATSRVIAGVAWKNAWGGLPGSPADRVMRKGVPQAAEEITQALASQVPGLNK